MSWDVSLYKFTRRYKTTEEIAHDEQPLSLGSLSEVHAAVSEVFLGTDWSDPAWGIYDSEFGSIEFNVGKDDPVKSLGLHVRASDAVVVGILNLCERIRCQAIDLTDGSFLDQSELPAAGLGKWREYRDQIIGKTKG
ncbi:hypothetical protein [Burkholderia lata]|uniref:Uncharacterized protein n=1 Tax=Burkholderia lata (strain ATCC 17760 / DSM 23089 / LMG 22485 / NCIMB 9086 / R18194 / 383) TaxID=482957 RepID=A0A6P2V082_BURL3|nr:hypothetical protein [Burkholderia lata]VWC72923.1 hypothetical protein BLA18109_02666 [Burkholderia lata]